MKCELISPYAHPAARQDRDPQRLPIGEAILMILTLSAVGWLGVAALVEWLL